MFLLCCLNNGYYISLVSGKILIHMCWPIGEHICYKIVIFLNLFFPVALLIIFYFILFLYSLFFILYLAGSGLHTFVLYLGPHIALFTIKAMKCGRVDIKSAPYDTIQLKRGPSWLDKDCSEFGPPLFSSLHGAQIPISSILPQVQLEAILWGMGTALGELPPYFISRAGTVSKFYVEILDK